MGTWLDRPGASLTIHLDSKPYGRRVVVHVWDGEEHCSVRYIQGNFWRPRTEAEIGVEFGGVAGIPYEASAIVAAAKELIES